MRRSHSLSPRWHGRPHPSPPHRRGGVGPPMPPDFPCPHRTIPAKSAPEDVPMPTVAVNGCQLFYAEDDFVEPWEPHEAVLMSHFVFGNHTEFRRWVPTLAREFRVLRLDRRGNGYSEKPPLGYAYTLDGLLADFVGFLDALGIERVHYVGDSLGGVLGAALAARHPERVKSLVLCATPCWIKPATQAGFVREGYADPIAAVMGMG